MKAVRFLKAHRMYQPGEEAGFEDTVADALIASGHAVDAKAARAAAAVKAAEDAEKAAADAKAAEAAAKAAAEKPASGKSSK